MADRWWAGFGKIVWFMLFIFALAFFSIDWLIPTILLVILIPVFILGLKA